MFYDTFEFVYVVALTISWQFITKINCSRKYKISLFQANHLKSVYGFMIFLGFLYAVVSLPIQNGAVLSRGKVKANKGDNNFKH
jgi:hypothetical protein